MDLVQPRVRLAIGGALAVVSGLIAPAAAGFGGESALRGDATLATGAGLTTAAGLAGEEAATGFTAA